ncbi:cytochrome c-type biogenesis protein CcmH [Aliidiomarina halalkaliphila]|uniref:Cytochrome c-type biogenesis protein n=2 Tax=Aliidiomarina halalkaliphila TaxID=2593535 RepID=A0A552X7J7_9GAMM|nr:cytochrome c-type biogenesis protein CcmH [Aliidiomarina halalkaliphila]
MLSTMLFALLVGLAATHTAHAAGEYYAFDTAEQERRFSQLTGELRCPKCQNQSIADSDAPLAQDMRQRVYQMIMEGRSNAEIIEFMKVRYGDFVHYRPPVNRSTLVLWFGPFVALFIGMVAVVVHVRGKRKVSAELTDEERAKLAAYEAELAQRDELEKKEQDR